MNLCELCRGRYFFMTGTTTQPEVDSVNSRAEKHQMTTFFFFEEAEEETVRHHVDHVRSGNPRRIFQVQFILSFDTSAEVMASSHLMSFKICRRHVCHFPPIFRQHNKRMFAVIRMKPVTWAVAGNDIAVVKDSTENGAGQSGNALYFNKKQYNYLFE